MGSRTVLVVEDDPVILQLLEVNFEMEGWEVVTAADGAAGLDAARQHAPDVIVMDIMMPKMTGLEVVKALKADDATASIPVLLLSARAQNSDVEAGLEVGADDYLTKPFEPDELVERVERLLS